MEIIINNKRINYEISGKGNPVVLLHGWLANLDTMKPLANRLSQKFKVYNIDIIGFGKSELPDKPMNTDDYGNFLKDLLEKLEIKNPILIGHSNGGRMIINAVGRGIVKPKKIVLIDSAGIKPKRKISYYIKIYTFKLLKNICKLLPNQQQLKEKVLQKFGSADYKNSPEVLRKTMSNILNELIWGQNDTAISTKDAKIMEKLIPDSGLVLYENSGHYSYLENLNNCIIVLFEFLKNDE